MRLNQLLILLLFTSFLSACGGGSSTTTSTGPTPPSDTVLSVSANGVITVSGKALANTTVNITFPDGSTQTIAVDGAGNFSATSPASQPAGNTTITNTDADNNTSEPTVIAATTSPNSTGLGSDSNGIISVSGIVAPNATVMATFPDGSTATVSADNAGNYTISSSSPQAMGEVQITSTVNGTSSAPTIITTAEIEKVLYQATGIVPSLSFSPSLGINTEAPQGGADTAGMPMPFVDIFRTARPFAELSDENTTFDANGWPSAFATGVNFARTKLLQGALDNSIPEGQYTVLYEGNGTLEFGSSGSVSNIQKISGESKYTFDLDLNDFDSEDEVAASDTNAFNMNIKDITASDYIKNIRIVMPGGTCTGNPYIRVASQAECPNGTTYESFSERLASDRNAIIFNPDYLAFLRNFKVIRMMNLMESSLKGLCFDPTLCPATVGTWNHRAMLNDAVWGGNDGRTAEEDHKGVPIEVMVALANTLKRDIWVNMPHVATNDYVNNYAQYVYTNLDPNLKVYVELSNEVWNNGFAAHHYAEAQGITLGLNTVPSEYQGTNRDGDYFARLRYYSQRAEAMFVLWKAQFAGSDARLVRVLGSFIGDKILTQEMLKHIGTDNVDAVAIAPYFFGCPYEAICIDAPKTLATAVTVDDVFAALDQDGDIDVKSIDGTIDAVKNQLTITNAYNTKLLTYEGGQHLVTGVLGNTVSETEKTRLRGLFNEANRDPRMKQRYETFLNAWKDLSVDGTTLFTLYTMPQSFYRFGNFGIKEHLNKSRNESPKFDGAMSFQESAGQCWWDACGP